MERMNGFWFEVFPGNSRPTGSTSCEEPLFPDGRHDWAWHWWNGSEEAFQEFFERELEDEFGHADYECKRRF